MSDKDLDALNKGLKKIFGAPPAALRDQLRPRLADAATEALAKFRRENGFEKVPSPTVKPDSVQSPALSVSPIGFAPPIPTVPNEPVITGATANIVVCVDNGDTTYTQKTAYFRNGLLMFVKA